MAVWVLKKALKEQYKLPAQNFVEQMENCNQLSVLASDFHENSLRVTSKG